LKRRSRPIGGMGLLQNYGKFGILPPIDQSELISMFTARSYPKRQTLLSIGCSCLHTTPRAAPLRPIDPPPSFRQPFFSRRNPAQPTLDHALLSSLALARPCWPAGLRCFSGQVPFTDLLQKSRARWRESRHLQGDFVQLGQARPDA